MNFKLDLSLVQLSQWVNNDILVSVSVHISVINTGLTFIINDYFRYMYDVSREISYFVG